MDAEAKYWKDKWGEVLKELMVLREVFEMGCKGKKKGKKGKK